MPLPWVNSETTHLPKGETVIRGAFLVPCHSPHVNVCPGSARACGDEKNNGDEPWACLSCPLMPLRASIRSRGGAGATAWRSCWRCGRAA